MFFGYFSRFIIAWKNAETQNEQRKKKLEAEARKQAAKDNIPEKPAPTEKVRVYNRPNITLPLFCAQTVRFRNYVFPFYYRLP